MSGGHGTWSWHLEMFCGSGKVVVTFAQHENLVDLKQFIVAGMFYRWRALYMFTSQVYMNIYSQKERKQGMILVNS